MALASPATIAAFRAVPGELRSVEWLDMFGSTCPRACADMALLTKRVGPGTTSIRMDAEEAVRIFGETLP